MSDPRTAPAVVLLTVCVASASACSKPAPQPAPPAQQAQAAPPPPAAAPAQAAPPLAAPVAAPAAPAPAALGSAPYSANPEVRCDLLEVKRVSGNALLARWRVVHAGSTPDIYYDLAWKDVYFIDPAENKKYGFLTDSEGNRILDIQWGHMKPGQQWLSWAKFPAPPPTSNKISLSVGGFAPFEDVPVVP
jgi:hypothetical protein